MPAGICLSQNQPYRAMVAAQDVSVDGGGFYSVAQTVRCDEVVDTPPRVLLARLEAVTPPRVYLLCVRVEETEGVREAGIQEFGHLGALLVGKARVHAVCLRILQVNLLMRHVQVTAIYDGFLSVQLHEVGTQVRFPLHAVVEALQPVLRVRRIAAHEIEVLHFQSDEAPLVVVLLYAHAVGYGQWRVACEDGRAAVSFLLGIVPVAVISRQVKGNLPLLEFRFLKAEEIRIQGIECLVEVLAYYGTQAVYIPTDEFHVLSIAVDRSKIVNSLKSEKIPSEMNSSNT